MKRSPLTRRTPLERTGYIKKRNAKRADLRRARDFGPQSELCRRCECVACFAEWFAKHYPEDPPPTRVLEFTEPRGTVPHHIPSRGAGGTDADTVPLCTRHHDESHAIGQDSFWSRCGVDPEAVKARLREMVASGGATRPGTEQG